MEFLYIIACTKMLINFVSLRLLDKCDMKETLPNFLTTDFPIKVTRYLCFKNSNNLQLRLCNVKLMIM